MEKANEIKGFMEHVEKCVERAFNEEKVNITITLDGKPIDFTFNADLYENLNRLLQVELEWEENRR